MMATGLAGVRLRESGVVIGPGNLVGQKLAKKHTNIGPYLVKIRAIDTHSI
jgi:hypothetical protein